MASKAFFVAAPVGKGFAVSAVASKRDIPADAVATWQLTLLEATLARRIANARFRAIVPDFRWGVIELPRDVVERECGEAVAAVERLRGIEWPPDPSIVLQALLDAWGFPQATVAEITGAAPSTVGRWLTGELEPSWTQLARLRMFARVAGFRWSDDDVLGSLPARKKPQRRAAAMAGAEG